MKISALPPTLTPTTTHEIATAKSNASTKMTIQQIINLVRQDIDNGAPVALNTLKKLATAINNDENFATTLATALSGKQPVDGMLTALAALSTVANRFLAFTDVDTPVARAINGTVAGTLAAPTGALFEYGSNGNGEYVKFANGLLVCWLNISPTNQAINTAYGSLFQGSRTWTFPAAFNASPAVCCGSFRWGSGAAWPSIAAAASNTDVSLRGMDNVSRASGTAVDICAVAVGKAF